MPTTSTAVLPADVTRVSIDQLVPSALNPRRTFNVDADEDLLESIRAHGILTPLLVRCIEQDEQDTYEIVAGHRRYTAAIELGLTTVPVTVRELTDDQARETAIIENLQREDLAPLDEATAYAQLLARPGQTPTMVASAVGKSPAYVGRRLKLLTLTDEGQTALREGRLSVAHAELLIKLDPGTQATALKEAVWLPLYLGGHGDEGTADTLESLRDLRDWVERHTKLDLADVESLALFPEAAELVGAVQDEPGPAILEVALDHYGQSPQKASIPTGVLRLNQHFRQVTGKRCAHAQTAIVVFGQMRGDVLLVCTAKKTCLTHWPPKVKADPTAAKRSQSWAQQEVERKRRDAIWEKVQPAAVQALIDATKSVKSTPTLLREVIEFVAHDQVLVAIKAVGTLTPLTFGRAYTIATGLTDYYTDAGAARELKRLGSKFDVAKAMKTAEAMLVAQEQPVKAEAKQAAATPTKKAPRSTEKAARP